MHQSTFTGFGGTSSRSFEISCKFVSRTAKEATINLNRLNQIRAWVVNDFGVGNTGAPPPILHVRGYGRLVSEFQAVLNSYSTSYPNDIDYIYTTDGTPFPPVLSVSLSFNETYSPEQVRYFNRENLKNGGNGIVGFQGTKGDPSGGIDGRFTYNAPTEITNNIPTDGGSGSGGRGRGGVPAGATPPFVGALDSSGTNMVAKIMGERSETGQYPLFNPDGSLSITSSTGSSAIQSMNTAADPNGVYGSLYSQPTGILTNDMTIQNQVTAADPTGVYDFLKPERSKPISNPPWATP